MVWGSVQDHTRELGVAGTPDSRTSVLTCLFFLQLKAVPSLACRWQLRLNRASAWFWYPPAGNRFQLEICEYYKLLTNGHCASETLI